MLIYLALDDARCSVNLVTYKWDTSVKVNIHSFHLKRKTFSCSGHLNQTAFWMQQKYGTQKGCVLKINHKFSNTNYISLFHLLATPTTDSESSAIKSSLRRTVNRVNSQKRRA